LIDESSAKEIKSDDKFGVFKVTGLNPDITMDNENSVGLSQNSETTLMGKMKFVVADNTTLRFYPKVDIMFGEVPPIETPTPTLTGTPAKPGNTSVPTVPPTVKPPEATPAGAAKPVEPIATTPKEPGFEAVFAIAGLLAVAFLVLRQRK
jgi:PGF-CTERM protein